MAEVKKSKFRAKVPGLPRKRIINMIVTRTRADKNRKYTMECITCKNITYSGNPKAIYSGCSVCYNDPDYKPYESLPDEEWRDVVGHEGLYWVSNYGEIRNNKGTVLSKCKSLNGYLNVYLSKENGRSVNTSISRSVAIAFIPNPENKPHVNHIDRIKTNNHVSNLEWVTRSENMLHSYETGHNRERPVGENNKRSKAVLAIGSDGKELRFGSISDAKRAGFDTYSIIKVCKGIKETYRGYKWGYEEKVNDTLTEDTDIVFDV